MLHDVILRNVKTIKILGEQYLNMKKQLHQKAITTLSLTLNKKPKALPGILIV